ncbi:hypothetical protein EW146_g6738 [Bondarzewia mesenterica]|uniref:DUF1365 domain-containing protein n=1 Tax=Bondarzewia mesenterica TaxID=1095465 RepID=A0A4V3XEF3_9AGAM|nr:hypothetical protein EW146_g6738 [Bondarzewia mesenterica]
MSHRVTPKSEPDATVPRGYILTTTVTHSRLLPADSRHAFTYPVLTFFLSLSALELGRLSLLRGFLFSYGGVAFRFTGLRASSYLFEDGGKEGSIKAKLTTVLQDFGLENAGEFWDAWIMTMPSYLGYEGINPLTVYFCYKKNDVKLWAVVLEVHNTFEERHVYILEVGKNEETPDRGFDHQWTCPRTFHVSPFNDRAGSYTISIRSPSHAPYSRSPVSYPKPAVRIHHHTPLSAIDTPSKLSKEKGALKLMALHWTSNATPFTAPSLMRALLTHPFILLMTLPRILRHAFVLHYGRRLKIWKRPEMKPIVRGWGASQGDAKVDERTTDVKGGGIRWQKPTLLERLSEKLICAFLTRRAIELGMDITLQPGNPYIPSQTFTPANSETVLTATNGGTQKKRLTISYLSPRLFTLLLLAPSAEVALALGGPQRARGGEVGEFITSDDGLFRELFALPLSAHGRSTDPVSKRSFTQWLRACRSPLEAGGYGEMRVPPTHALDPPTRNLTAWIPFVLILGASFAAEWFEWWLWTAARIRWVGREAPADELGA